MFVVLQRHVIQGKIIVGSYAKIETIESNALTIINDHGRSCNGQTSISARLLPA